MEALINWITQIIVFILLAIIVELFVPTSKMAKYVRLVIGLIFLLILLQPVLFLFKIDMEQIIYEQLLHPISITEQSSLDDEVLAQKERLHQTSQNYILTEVTERLKEQAEDILRKQSLQIKNIDYKFHDISTNIQSLEQLIVYIVPRTDATGEIVEIDEITIDIDQTVNVNDDENLLEIKSKLQDVWQLNDEELIVKWGK